MAELGLDSGMSSQPSHCKGVFFSIVLFYKILVCKETMIYAL
jgi:hypothetical protein